MGIPEKKFKLGNVSATVWNNPRLKDGQPVDMKSVQITKSYKDSKGEWQSTNSFSVNDLPKVKMLVDQVYKYLLGLKD